MEERKKDLSELRAYTEGIDAEVTMILQQLQWDRKRLLQDPSLVKCKYDINHLIPADKKEAHEDQCFLIHNGYSKGDVLLPSPIDTNTATLVKLSKEEVQQIIDNASKNDQSFKRVFKCFLWSRKIGSDLAEPLTLDRVQATYTSEERRAIHDAVVSAVPLCHNLADLALLSENGVDQKNCQQKSRVEILAELRDMKRRRTKYRVAAKTRNFSDVLRDVIKTQMEMYSEVKEEHSREIKIEPSNNEEIKYRPRERSSNKQSNEKSQIGYDYKKSDQKNTRHKRNRSIEREESQHSSRSKRSKRHSSDDDKSANLVKSYDKKQTERHRHSETYDTRKHIEESRRYRNDHMRSSKDRTRHDAKTKTGDNHKYSSDHYRREHKHEHRKYYETKQSDLSKREKRNHYEYRK